MIILTFKMGQNKTISFSDFRQLTKAGLSLSVVFSSVSGYFLGMETFSWATVFLISLGGYSLVGASNTFNQIVEQHLDRLMVRTRNRPIPSGRVSPKGAFIIGTFLATIGLVLLYLINPKTAAFGAVSLFLYVSVYTPLKVRTPLSVFAGAFPGAIPFMLGWVAATGKFGIEAGVLFMIQFFWQFPHFWAIGWMLDDDYKKAGFRMLPTNKKDKGVIIQILLYTLWTMIIAVIPITGMTGRLYLSVGSGILISALGVAMLWYGMKLYRYRDNPSARRLMLWSVLYITLIQIIYVADKYIIQ